MSDLPVRSLHQLEHEFIRKLHMNFGPIGPKEELWFVIRDCQEMFISHHNFLLIFSCRDLAEKFFSFLSDSLQESCWIEYFFWGEISDYCKKRTPFCGVVVDFIVREDFSFHNF